MNLVLLLRRNPDEVDKYERAALQHRVLPEFSFIRSDAETGTELLEECRRRKPVAVLLPPVKNEGDRIELDVNCKILGATVCADFPVYAFVPHLAQNRGTIGRMLAWVTPTGLLNFNFKRQDVVDHYTAAAH